MVYEICVMILSTLARFAKYETLMQKHRKKMC